MSDFRELKVWGKAHQLTIDVYRATDAFPHSEMYALTGQIRRAAASIPANIAEGCGLGRDGEMARHVRIAQGSATELEYHLILARDLGYLDATAYTNLNAELSEVGRMLSTLNQRIQARLCAPKKPST